ncbi:hypothetical protein [Hoeflea sp.]|uniref:hypothetical protein n=1 Tax=Hoeflea sp. TaxID=1940281 RepID=UPI0025BCA03F|nr:hypothetical protein [Hoeflea sp.]
MTQLEPSCASAARYGDLHQACFDNSSPIEIHENNPLAISFAQDLANTPTRQTLSEES